MKQWGNEVDNKAKKAMKQKKQAMKESMKQWSNDVMKQAVK